MVSRRGLLSAAVAGGAASAAAPLATAAPSEKGLMLPSAQALKPLHEPFINLERAYALMEANQIDGLVLRIPTNVYYVTGSRPLFGMENWDTGPITVVSRGADPGIAIIMPSFSYYYQYADSRPTYPFRYYLYTGAAAAARTDLAYSSAVPARGLPDLGLHPQGPVEAFRAEALEKAVARIPPSVDADGALKAALKGLGLTKGRLAIDSPLLAARLGALEPGVATVPGDNLVRRMRQVKTPAAIALNKAAAQANVDAARAAVMSTVRPGATYRELRAAFYREVALRGGNPVGLLINAVSSPTYDAEFKPGDVFLIDAVSEFELCHGDYGRTISIGEPPASMKRATAAAALGWSAIRDKLKPGLKFSEITAIGKEVLRREGYDFDVRFGPHNVGLNHNEDPYHANEPFFIADTPLEAGMILSVDCPVLNSGIGGSAHLEDLVVITADGHVPLNEIAAPVIIV